MSSRLAILALLSFSVLAFGVESNCLSADEAADAKAKRRAAKPATTSEQRIAAALDRSGNWEFLDEPLTDVAHFIRATCEIDVVIDRRALSDYGIGDDTPMTFGARGIRLRSFLRHGLGQLDLTWLVRDEALWITTPEEAEAELRIKTYPVNDLVRVSQTPGESAYDYHSMIGAITTCIAPDSWENVGGPGTIEGIYGTLVISQTEEILDQIGMFLAGYRKAFKQLDQPQEKILPIAIEDLGDSHDRIRAVLDKPTTIEWLDEPLAGIVADIARRTEINVLLDVYSLEDYGIASDTPITIAVNDISLRSALRRMLHDLDLTFAVRDEALVITTEEEAECCLSIVFYLVHDLVPVLSPTGDTGPERDFDTLIEVITSSVQPDSWDDVGGPGAIVASTRPPMLVISQTDDVHEKVLALLGRLRLAKQAEQKASREPVDMASLVARKTTRVYSLNVDDKGKTTFPAKEVIQLIQMAVEPSSWMPGQDAFVLSVGNSVVVRHSEQVHREIEKLLGSVGAWNGYSFGGVGGMGRPTGGFGGGMGGFGGGGMGGFGGGGGYGSGPGTGDDEAKPPSGGGGFFSVVP